MQPNIQAGLLFGAYLGEFLRHGQPRKGWTDTTIDLLRRALEVRPERP